MRTYTLDATNKKLGRVASDAAQLIMGKNRSDFARNTIPSVTVVIEHASQADISERKLRSSKYQSYSGFPGGRKVLNAAQLAQQKGYPELFRKAVYGMLPTNKLRARMIKRLVVKA